MLSMQALQGHGGRGDSGSSLGPRFDEEAVLQLAQRELSAKNYQAALGAAELVLRRSPDNPRAKRIAEQTGEVMGTSALYGGFLRAADRREADAAASLYGEIPGESSFRAGAWEPFRRCAASSCRGTWPWPAQRRALAPATSSASRWNRFATSPTTIATAIAAGSPAVCALSGRRRGGRLDIGQRAHAHGRRHQRTEANQRAQGRQRRRRAARSLGGGKTASAKPSKATKKFCDGLADPWGGEEEKPRKTKKKKAAMRRRKPSASLRQACRRQEQRR